MILVRQVLQARFGRGGELAALGVEVQTKVIAELGEHRRWRILTDLSGPFDTVVLEIAVENLAEWEQLRPRLFGADAFRAAFAQMQELTASGQSQLYTIEAEG